jgi:hypothetical protein
MTDTTESTITETTEPTKHPRKRLQRKAVQAMKKNLEAKFGKRVLDPDRDEKHAENKRSRKARKYQRRLQKGWT